MKIHVLVLFALMSIQVFGQSVDLEKKCTWAYMEPVVKGELQQYIIKGLEKNAMGIKENSFRMEVDKDHTSTGIYTYKVSFQSLLGKSYLLSESNDIGDYVLLEFRDPSFTEAEINLDGTQIKPASCSIVVERRFFIHHAEDLKNVGKNIEVDADADVISRDFLP